jgi:DNA-binding response OmpR family regulator
MTDNDPTRGTETILLAEDDPSVRKYVQMALRAQGYAILEAHSGAEALRVSDSHPGVIHLLISDILMPEMSGGQLAEELVRRRPGIRVLFLSGYTEDIMHEHGIKADAAFLQKPFSPSALSEKVREILNR